MTALFYITAFGAFINISSVGCNPYNNHRSVASVAKFHHTPPSVKELFTYTPSIAHAEKKSSPNSLPIHLSVKPKFGRWNQQSERRELLPNFGLPRRPYAPRPVL